MTTPFEAAGYTKNDKFRVVNNSNSLSDTTYEGQIVWLAKDDGSTCPYFYSEKGVNGSTEYQHVIFIVDLEKIESIHTEKYAELVFEILKTLPSLSKEDTLKLARELCKEV